MKLRPYIEKAASFLDDTDAVEVCAYIGKDGPKPIPCRDIDNDHIKEYIKQLKAYALELAEKVRQVPGATDVDISDSDDQPEIVIKLDQARASSLGLDSTSVGEVVEMAFMGKDTGNSYTIGDNDYDIILQMPGEWRTNINDVKNLRISNDEGQFIRLGDVATVELSSGPTRIEREDKRRQIVVYANTVGISPGDLIKVIKEQLIPEMNMDTGYSYKMVGQADRMARTFNEVSKAIILAIVVFIIIMNTMVISVLERTGEIGTMRAIGADKSFVRKLFFCESITLTLGAELLGTILSLVIMTILNACNFTVSDDIAKMILGGGSISFIPTVGNFVSTMIIILVGTILAKVGWGSHPCQSRPRFYK